MDILDERTALIGSTELRTKISVVENMGSRKLVVMKRGKPVAILLDFNRYQADRERLEDLEDTVLGYIAKARSEKAKPEDYLTLEEVAQKLDIGL